MRTIEYDLSKSSSVLDRARSKYQKAIKGNVESEHKDYVIITGPNFLGRKRIDRSAIICESVRMDDMR